MADIGAVETEGARLVFEQEGRGPALLLISGGGGDAARYAALCPYLRDDYTLIRYDRRCASRSTGDPAQPMDMAQQARDARAVLQAAGHARGFIFGNSGAAAIAVKLAEDHPETIAGLVVHEPSLFELLPDRDDVFAFIDKVEAMFRTHGGPAAMQLFGTSLVGLDNLPLHRSGAALEDVASDENLDHFLTSEFHHFSRYAPDMARLHPLRRRIIACAGRASGTVYYARTARALAQALGCQYRRISGHHVAFVTAPACFAAELHALLGILAARAQTA